MVVPSYKTTYITLEFSLYHSHEKVIKIKVSVFAKIPLIFKISCIYPSSNKDTFSLSMYVICAVFILLKSFCTEFLRGISSLCLFNSCKCSLRHLALFKYINKMCPYVILSFGYTVYKIVKCLKKYGVPKKLKIL